MCCCYTGWCGWLQSYWGSWTLLMNCVLFKPVRHVTNCCLLLRVVCPLQPVMDTIISLMLHPRLTDKLASGNKSGWLDPIIPLTLFLAFGIFTVMQKYHKKHNSPIPFQYPVPQVRIHGLLLLWPGCTLICIYSKRVQVSKEKLSQMPISALTTRILNLVNCFLLPTVNLWLHLTQLRDSILEL